MLMYRTRRVAESMSVDKIEEIEKNEKKPQKKSERDKNGIIGGIVFGVIFLICAYQSYVTFFDFPIGHILVLIFGMATFILFAVAVSSIFDYKESKKYERLEEEAKKEEAELAEIKSADRMLRAEKLYRMNQKELMRYYDMNLAQTKFLSGLGIIMIAFGVCIVLVSMYLYKTIDADKTILFIGSLSGIIVDFIGTLFIKMYTKNVEASVRFHAKFADSNNLLLANSIAHKIDDDRLREETLSEISKNIISTSKSA